MSLRLALTILTICGAVLSAEDPAAQAMRELVQGEWAMLSAQDDGYDFLNRGQEKTSVPRVLRVEGDQWTFNYKDGRLVAYRAVLDGAQQPMALDMHLPEGGRGATAGTLVLGSVAHDDGILAMALQLSHPDRGRMTELGSTSGEVKGASIDKIWCFMREDGFTDGLPTGQEGAGDPTWTASTADAACSGPQPGPGGSVVRCHLLMPPEQGLRITVGEQVVTLIGKPTGGGFQILHAASSAGETAARTRTCSSNGNGKEGPVWHSIDILCTPQRLRVWGVGTTLADIPLQQAAQLRFSATAAGVALRRIRWKALP